MRWLVILLSVVVAATASASPRDLAGWGLYDRYCLACHGANGDGKGPAAPFSTGRPRDLTTGQMKWRSTQPGQPATDDDLRITIRYGVRGTSMHDFALSAAQIDQLIAVVKAFAPDAYTRESAPVALAASPPARDAARGRALWNRLGCVACHGLYGDANTPAGRQLVPPPYDFTRQPFKRPRAADDADSRRRAIAMSIATGLAGTAMPSYTTAIPEPDIWALADHVYSINALAKPAEDRSVLDAQTIALDGKPGLAVGTWPGGGDSVEATLFGGAIAAQGTPPPSLGPAQASLRAQDCGRCHAKQFREWQPSVHRGATSPGLAAQMYGMKPAQAASCLRCHAPLAEQQTDAGLHADGVSCGGCHVRGWQRHGPPNVAPSLLPLPSYPLATLAIYERADFCLPCHQLPPRTATEGKPLLNTYKEWLESPYMRRGVQCQHCHMPNREHTFRGIHDREMFANAIAVRGSASAKDDVVTVRAELENVGAGHKLPTTPTPAAWLVVELLDARGAPIAGASHRHRIGRDIYFDGTWHEREDTRIRPGNSARIVRAWRGGRVRDATQLRITVEVHPDDYYERLYETRLRQRMPAARRVLYEQALARGRANRYTATTFTVPLTR